jgi:hypothetical protein
MAVRLHHHGIAHGIYCHGRYFAGNLIMIRISPVPAAGFKKMLFLSHHQNEPGKPESSYRSERQHA